MGSSSGIRCSVCGSPEVVAKIKGKYYCYKCGSKITRKHLDELLKSLKEKGIVEI